MLSIHRLAILYLHLVVLVQSRVLVAPADDSIDSGPNADELHAVDMAMQDLLKKHNDFIEKHIGRVELTNFRAKSQSTKDHQFKGLRKPQSQSQSDLKNDLRFHMTPITMKDVSYLKQRLRHKFRDFMMNAPDMEDKRGTNMKSLLLFYSNE
ncbi:hypothetical protein HG536_0F02530 [Torulaspora globosa]|uniref:Uncharacterized protein n=1 Tax=Torulaspora globosa TaxID=48254 RepID=A0A7G3ZK92_9SACH|nr:uncharacterized protein HG536_0F02530 [Torulaspora globosa]QLL33928.1 hypothetical protein HG536_0F02530 [Torulaspora globosa]